MLVLRIIKFSILTMEEGCVRHVENSGKFLITGTTVAKQSQKVR